MSQLTSDDIQNNTSSLLHDIDNIDCDLVMGYIRENAVEVNQLHLKRFSTNFYL